jgi:hypothetical protein
MVGQEAKFPQCMLLKDMGSKAEKLMVQQNNIYFQKREMSHK